MIILDSENKNVVREINKDGRYITYKSIMKIEHDGVEKTFTITSNNVSEAEGENLKFTSATGKKYEYNAYWLIPKKYRKMMNELLYSHRDFLSEYRKEIKYAE